VRTWQIFGAQILNNSFVHIAMNEKNPHQKNMRQIEYLENLPRKISIKNDFRLASSFPRC
jgi:hypothetical protein